MNIAADMNSTQYDIYEVNRALREQFLQSKSEKVLIPYIMSEVLYPIEDYPNVVKLLKENFDIITDVRLLYMGSHLLSWWKFEDNFFLDILFRKLPTMTPFEQAIVYYLKADDLNTLKKTDYEFKQYKEYLRKSVALSKGCRFASNRYFLAENESVFQAKILLQEAWEMVEKTHPTEERGEVPLSYRLDIQNWINEFILGLCGYLPNEIEGRLSIL